MCTRARGAGRHSMVVLFGHMAAGARGAGMHRWSMVVVFGHMVVRFVVVSSMVLTGW